MATAVTAATAAVLLVLSLDGCRGTPGVAWSALPPAPGARPYPGATDLQDTRLSGLVTERGLRTIARRVEELPAGVTWAQHRSFRDENAAGLDRVQERIPEPDAPVLVAEYAGRGRTVFVIARADAAREHLIVLTALAEPR